MEKQKITVTAAVHAHIMRFQENAGQGKKKQNLMVIGDDHSDREILKQVIGCDQFRFGKYDAVNALLPFGVNVSDHRM